MDRKKDKHSPPKKRSKNEMDSSISNDSIQSSDDATDVLVQETASLDLATTISEEKITNENLTTKAEKSPLTATVFVAAPHLKNHSLAVTGKGSLLGNWKVPKGEFKSIVQISDELAIYHGIIPIPSVVNSPFKFIHVNEKNDIEYEGDGPGDNRYEELLPESWNFFIYKFKPSKKSFWSQLFGNSRDYLQKSEAKEKIAAEFFQILFTQAIEIAVSDLDSAFEFLLDGLQKVSQAIGAGASNGFRGFINEKLSSSELQVDFDQLLLLLIGACWYASYPEKLRNILQSQSKEFSFYLKTNQSKIKRKRQDFVNGLEQFAMVAGEDFIWILFTNDNHYRRLQTKSPSKVSDSIIKTLREMPQLLLDLPKTNIRIADYLVRHNDIDKIYRELQEVFLQNANYRQLMEPVLLEKYLTFKTSMDNLNDLLRSYFLESLCQFYSIQRTNDTGLSELQAPGWLRQSIENIYNRKLSNVIKLAIITPNHVLPLASTVVEKIVLQKLSSSTLSREDYRNFAHLDEGSLNNFPNVKNRIEAVLLQHTVEFLKTGCFQEVPTLKLILLGLAERKDNPLLEEAKVVHLQKAMNKLPNKFFQNLYFSMKNFGGAIDKTLKPFRNGKTKKLVEQLESHFDQLDEIVAQVVGRRIPLIELVIFNDPKVIDCLKTVGLTEKQQTNIRQDVEELKKRHLLYGAIYSTFSRLNIAGDEEDEDEDEEPVEVLNSIQVLNSQEWEEYLKDIDVTGSIVTLQRALETELPMDPTSAKWLMQVKDCKLFMQKLWHPAVEFMPSSPLSGTELQEFIKDLAEQWVDMAQRVANGEFSFVEMGDIIKLQPDDKILSRNHLDHKSIDGIRTAYKDFKNMQSLRNSIGPFVAALRFFSIREKAPIEKLNEFVNNELRQNWDKMTLKEVRDSGIVSVLNDELKIDPDRPETTDAVLFISSLVTDGNNSPLIEWLREKSGSDMEAMGKVLHGTLLEAYGKLQTLRTRISPFLQNEFNTYQDLLRAARESEERFTKRISGRVQPIDCKWLANMLPEIQAAVRASVISPSEDAKEKLANLHRIVIEPKNDTYTITIHLKSRTSLSMDELKQAFQLLDMAVLDDEDAGDLVERTRRNVGLIQQLSEVFSLLFASGCITYTFLNPIWIELDGLELEIEGMREQLEKWTQKWEKVEKLPYLALFSRGYLLQLANLIGRRETETVVSILKFVLPSASSDFETQILRLVQRAPKIRDDESSWLSTTDVFKILHDLHEIIQQVFNKRCPEIDLPPFLVSYGRTLQTHFMGDKAVVILNVSRELLVGSSLAAYIAVTRRPIEPSRILFVTANTSKSEVERFMKLWSVANKLDFFIIVHVERLSPDGASAIREGVNLVLPERRAKLLLLAQHHHRASSTKSLGARLGLVADRLLDTNFTVDQLRQSFATLLPRSTNLHFFTSTLPGCGKSQKAMQLALNTLHKPDYYRIPVRIGSVEELLASLKKIENISSQSRKQTAFLHLDVAHSASLEFNDILLSLLIHGALYDPQKAKLGFWMISPKTTIAVEFASPFGEESFPVISYLGQHQVCQCEKTSFTYEIVQMPLVIGSPVILNRSNTLVAAGKFLSLKQAGAEGLRVWDELCSSPETLILDPLPEEDTYELLVNAFHHIDNRTAPTFSALNAMASFLHRHISGMLNSMWFNTSAVLLFENDGLARVFKLNVFNMLLKVANDSIARCWSMTNKDKKIPEMDWINRQRAMFLLGLDEDGSVTGMNVVGRDLNALKNMFHSSLLPILQHQCLQFQELHGFNNLMQNSAGAQVLVNALRSLLLLDGTATSAVKVYQLDSHPRNVPASQLIRELTGEDQGYVLTGDNITKMMFALYRIRCGLPVIVFGEAGVGKSALFRFLIQTLLGHTYEVCNVNSGTSIQDVEKMIESAMGIVAMNPNAQVFLFFDEMNTADLPVIAFLKELMLDRHCHGTVLPGNIHLMAAANPYRYLQEADKEATVGLAFRFSQGAESSSTSADGRNLVYRVNQLPVAFYDHIYDFGHLCLEAEQTYIEEICSHGLAKFKPDTVKWFVEILRKSHRVARALSVDPDSAVSLRDATRAVQLFCWFCHAPAGKKVASDPAVAADLTVYLVYAFRFRKRKTFLENVFGKHQTASKNMTEVSKTIAKMLYQEAHGASIGSGAVALNDALCENLFALYVCVLNGIFLIIVGRPGSSKSLSVEILKLVLSPGNHALRQKLGDLPAVSELYFQCSPLSTSSGFKALFESAERLSVDPKIMLAMVVLDELGLADMSPEKPIKVLHSELERKATLTSGEKQQSPYSVVALSNWVVDAAQVNRGILILRKQADKNDLLKSAKELADSLIPKKFDMQRKRICKMLSGGLENIVNTYHELDNREDIGGGHFFSMRDFFFCVKNFVCSIFESDDVDIFQLRISDLHLVHSAIRNFGGHEKALLSMRKSIADNLEVDETAVPMSSPIDLIIQNIQDSSKERSIHIARHLMILTRSLIGLQLLNRHVRGKLGDEMNWSVLFGSCFPGDLQITAVTRKLRQVEQAIRKGGVLILCHADQLFESLYMVLNQQYWAQGEVTMTQIALGPSIRAIALPNGPFRIIALQDTDVALNRELMSPAILSRFEKHELRPSHLLKDTGRYWFDLIESHPVWLTVTDTVKRQKLLFGYHEDTIASLALELQEKDTSMEVDQDELEGLTYGHDIWMKAINPMFMIRLERDFGSHPELVDICRKYRHDSVLEGIDDALQKIRSDRMVIMTYTLRHLDITTKCRNFVIQLFDVQTELQLYRLLDGLTQDDLDDPDFCIIIQYDAVTGPIEQFQLAKYEAEQRFSNSKCRVIFIVHVDPRPVNMHWVFSFGDGWSYLFIDEVVSNESADQHRIPLRELMLSPADQALSEFIRPMSIEAFKLLLLEMLGPVLQTSLSSLQANLGQFYCGVRTALGLPNQEKLIQLLKECLLAQLDQNGITWSVIDAVSDTNFDSSSSLTEGLWGVFKYKLSNTLAHLLLVSDVWRVGNRFTTDLWCDFVTANYPNRLISLGSSDSIVQIPVGFHSCSQPFGRLLATFDGNFAQHNVTNWSSPLQWLLNRIAKTDNDDSQIIKEAYFLDWFMLRTPPHLHPVVRQLKLPKMVNLVDSLFEESAMFFLEWENSESEVMAALELLSIASFSKNDGSDVPKNLWGGVTSRIRNWKVFADTSARICLETLASPNVFKCNEKVIQSVSSIEASVTLSQLVDRVEGLSKLWLGLRIAKLIFIFHPTSGIKLPELQLSTPYKIFESLTELLVESIVRPKIRTKRPLKKADLKALVKATLSCTSPEELGSLIRECPTTNSIVLQDQTNKGDANCPSCNSPLFKAENTTEDDMEDDAKLGEHLRIPNKKTVESFFQSNQEFMFFFEQVAELYIYQHKNNPHEIRDFLMYLLNTESCLRVSWRFLTVIVRTVLSTRSGSVIIDELLLTMPCNRSTKQLNDNTYSFLRAILAYADQDAGRNNREEVTIDIAQAAVTGTWTIDRIHRLAELRRGLTHIEENQTVNVFEEWINWERNQTDQPMVESLLYFLLRFCCADGDQTKLGQLFRHRRVADKLRRFQTISDFMDSLSPLALGFEMQLGTNRANPFQELLFKGEPIRTGQYEHYRLLEQLQPEWAPFIARFAFHAADVFENKHIRILRDMTRNFIPVSQYLLPGIDNHPYLASFQAEDFRWYVCSCGTLNCVGNCGNPTQESTCVQCRVALSAGYHNIRAGVRRATQQDFEPPYGIYMTRNPPVSPTFATRNCSPAVTRFALLLNCLALLNAALNPRTTDHAIQHLLLTLPLAERQPNENRRSLIQLLSQQIIVHLDFLCQLLVTSKPRLNMTDKFRIGHILLHKLLDFKDRSLQTRAEEFNKPQARQLFETGLGQLLAQQTDLGIDLDTIAAESDQATKNFQQSMTQNESSSWAYARLTFADRQTVLLELARDNQRRQKFPFLNMLLDDVWMQKLDSLQYLGDAMRFVALVRTVLQGEITQESAVQMTIAQGLEKVIDTVMQKVIILDRGRPISSRDNVMQLFKSFKQLWDRFSQITNAEHKTFLSHFGCQELNNNVQPEEVLKESNPLVLILAGSQLSEMAFCYQLLSHAIEAASAVSLTDFIQPHCRKGSGRVRLSCSSVAALADFDESVYAHVSAEEVDQFIRDHAIDRSTLQLAESFAMAAILGSAGSRIAEDLTLEILADFVFKDDVESASYLVTLERRSLAWQPSSITMPIQELILTDLEKNRSLAEARSVLISAITHLQSNTEPLIISKVRNNPITDVLEELKQAEILTERHISDATINTFNRYVKLEVRHVFGLLKAIISRMQGDDIFGGRIPEGWRTMLSDSQAKLTRQKLQGFAQSGSSIETVLQLANIVGTSQPIPTWLEPNKSLLFAIRQLEGNEWDGLSADIKMENLGHVLLILESISKK